MGRDRDKGLSRDQLPQKLADIAKQHLLLRDRLAALVTDDPDIQALIDQGHSEIGHGNYEQADSLLTQAEDAELVAARQAESLESQAREAKNRRYLNAAAIRARRGDNSLGQLRYMEAAAHYEEAAGLVSEGEALQCAFRWKPTSLGERRWTLV